MPNTTGGDWIMALSGYVKLYRSLLDWEWHDDPATLSVWIHLLLKANFVETEWRGIRLLPGQVVTGRAALASETGLSERQIRTALTRLKSTGCVTIETTNKYSIISLLNWEKFQRVDYSGDQQDDQQNDRRATSRRPAIDHTVKNIKIQEGKEEVAEPPPAVLAFDGTDLSGHLQQHQHAEVLIRRYGLPCIDATRDALLEDFERCGVEAVETALKEAALKDKCGGLSIAFYKSVLNRMKGEQHGKSQNGIESSWHVGTVV